MEGMGLKLTPVVVRHLLGLLGMFGPMAGSYFLDSQLLQTVLTEGLASLQLPILEKVIQNPAEVAS